MGDLSDRWKQFRLSEEENNPIVIENKNDSGSLNPSIFNLLRAVWDKKKINREAMVKTLGSIWNLKGKLVVKEIRENQFLFTFDEVEDYKKIMAGKPWCFDRCLLVLKEFDADFFEPETIDFEREDFWIHVHSLPLKLMTKELAILIGNAIGSFVTVDGEDDDLKDRFLRIKVSINLTKPLRRGMLLSMDEGKTRWLSFQYERLPQFCFKCGLIGHTSINCDSSCHDEQGHEVPDQYGNFLIAPL